MSTLLATSAILLVVTMTPAAACGVESGWASYYGINDNTAWHRTASGAPFDPWGMTAAHPSLPLGEVVRVLRMDNRKFVIVKITDRGPAKRLRRVIDVSAGAARELGMIREGVVRVAVLHKCTTTR